MKRRTGSRRIKRRLKITIFKIIGGIKGRESIMKEQNSLKINKQTYTY